MPISPPPAIAGAAPRGNGLASLARQPAAPETHGRDNLPRANLGPGYAVPVTSYSHEIFRPVGAERELP